MEEESYQQILQREINFRYRNSSKIYKLATCVHITKLAAIVFASVLYIYNIGGTGCALHSLIWLSVYGLLTIGNNIRYKLVLNENNYPRSVRIYELFITVYDYACWIYGLCIILLEPCYPFSYVMIVLLSFDLVLMLLSLILQILMCTGTCVRYYATVRRLYTLLVFISDQDMPINNFDSLPLCKYDNQQIVETNCSICLTDFINGDDVRKFQCNHVFHQLCIDNWLHLYNTCPMCRQIIFRQEMQTQEYQQKQINLIRNNIIPPV